MVLTTQPHSRKESILAHFFSYPSNFTLHPRQWISGWVGGWAEFQTSVALRLASLLGISIVIERQLGKPDVRLFVFPQSATSSTMSNKYSL